MKNSPLDHQVPRDQESTSEPNSERHDHHAAMPTADTESEVEFIFVDGVMLPFARAAVQISNIAAGNGSNVFEGMCLYATGRDQFLFRLKDHFANLRKSAWRMDIDCDYSDEDFRDAIFASVRENRITGDAHVRLSLFVTGSGPGDASGPVSLVCTARSRVSSSIHERSVHAAISTWRQVEDPLMPPRVRAEANSHNTRFGLLQVLRNGYDQAIFVSNAGKVGGAANASFLMVRGGCLVSPPETPETVERVTRATLLQIAAEDLGIEVREREIDRAELSHADEAMFCGSGMELRPVVSINKIRIGGGIVGPITRRLWHAYDATVRGRSESRTEWLTPLEARRTAAERDPHHLESGRWRIDLTRSGRHERRFARSGEVGHLLENGYQMGDGSIG